MHYVDFYKALRYFGKIFSKFMGHLIHSGLQVIDYCSEIFMKVIPVVDRSLKGLKGIFTICQIHSMVGA